MNSLSNCFDFWPAAGFPNLGMTSLRLYVFRTWRVLLRIGLSTVRRTHLGYVKSIDVDLGGCWCPGYVDSHVTTRLNLK